VGSLARGCPPQAWCDSLMACACRSPRRGGAQEGYAQLKVALPSRGSAGVLKVRQHGGMTKLTGQRIADRAVGGLGARPQRLPRRPAHQRDHPGTQRRRPARGRGGETAPALNGTSNSSACAAPAIGPGCRSLPEKAVAEEYDAVSESALIEELEAGAHTGRQPWLAPADDNGPDQQLALIDQPGPESLRREVGTSYGEIAAGRGLQLVYCGGVETAFESRVGR
jgi:hypothetical protein